MPSPSFSLWWPDELLACPPRPPAAAGSVRLRAAGADAGLGANGAGAAGERAACALPSPHPPRPTERTVAEASLPPSLPPCLPTSRLAGQRGGDLPVLSTSIAWSARQNAALLAAPSCLLPPPPTWAQIKMLISRTQEGAALGAVGAIQSETGVSVILRDQHELPACALDNDMLVEVGGCGRWRVVRCGWIGGWQASGRGLGQH